MNKKQQKKFYDKKERAFNLKKARIPTTINLMSFDQATKCGVAIELVGQKPFVELWDLSIKNKESQGVKWIRFEKRLKEYIKKYDIKLISYELPAGRNINPIVHSSKLIGIIEKTCVELNIEYMEVPTTGVKKFATGKGIANKEKMLKSANILWGYKGNDDNEADALHILHFTKIRLK